jgi:drug/metabolite transporter (DMT)-like permease
LSARTPRFVYLQLHLLVVLLATTAILGQLISLSAAALVVWRTALAALAASLLVVAQRRHRLILPLRRSLSLLGIGAIIGWHWLCFFGSIRLSNISVCLAGMATISFFTAFTEPWLEKRRVRPLEVLLGLLVVVGILLVAGFERGHLAGLLVALLGALLAAIFPVANRCFVSVAWEMAGAHVLCLLALPIFGSASGYGELFSGRPLDYAWLLVLAMVCTVFAHGFHIHLLRHMSAYTANLAINFEPIYGIAAAALVFGEHRELHPGFYLGLSTILLANLLHPWILRRLAMRAFNRASGLAESDS